MQAPAVLTYGARERRPLEVRQHVLDVERLFIAGRLADVAHEGLFLDAGPVLLGHVFEQRRPEREHGPAAGARVVLRQRARRRRQTLRRRPGRRDGQQRRQV